MSEALSAADPAGLAASPAMPASPLRVAWRRLRRNRTALLGGLVLAALYLFTLFGSFLQTADPGNPTGVTNHPPTMPRFFDENNQFHPRPFVFGMRIADPLDQRWEYDLTKKYPIHFFVRGAKYKLWWIFESDLHLMGVDAPGVLAPFGTEEFGIDVYSQVLQGGKVSLSIGLIAIAISLSIGLLVGGLAGYYGGWVDGALMRLVEFLLAIPSLYLIIALRAYFQTETFLGLGGSQITSSEMYIIIIVILSLIGWAAQARVVRGMVLSIKEQDFVMAERAMGAGTLRIIVRHILPNTLSYVIVSATIAVPGYILGEVALSFLGVGIQRPQVSWGNLLNDAQNVAVIRLYPWRLFAPAACIFLTVMAFNFLGDGLRDALDPRHVK